MEITCKIISVQKTFIRAQTITKKQEIDIYFPDNKFDAIDSFYEPNMVTKIEVELQTLDIDKRKYAKIWFSYVLFPKRNRVDQCNTSAAIDQRNKVAILFRKEDLV